MKPYILLLIYLVPLIGLSQRDTVVIKHDKLMYFEMYEGTKLVLVTKFVGVKKIPLNGVKSWRLITRKRRNYTRLYLNLLPFESNELDIYYDNLFDQQLLEDDHP